MTEQPTALFDEAAAYQGDPLRPDTLTVTPPSIVATLTPEQRRLRVVRLVNQAHAILSEAIDTHGEDKTIAAKVVLYSGGNDSTALAFMFRRRASHAAPANTGIGIEQTRQFVRDTCEAWGLPLIEEHGESYRDLVLDQGFPGPAMHWKMYQRLKERALRKVRARLVTDRSQRVVFIAGRRREESRRREDVPLHERDGSVIWASPLAMWTKLDLNTYRQMFLVPRNEVADRLHMSGECLCGAFAKPGELDEIAECYPDVAAEIHALEAEVKAAGWREPLCRWGHGEGRAEKPTGPLCTTCDARFIPGQLTFEDTA